MSSVMLCNDGECNIFSCFDTWANGEVLQGLRALSMMVFCDVIREVIRQADCSWHQLHFIRLMAAEGPWHEFKGNVMTEMHPRPSVSFLSVCFSFSTSVAPIAFSLQRSFSFSLCFCLSLPLLTILMNGCFNQSVFCVWIRQTSCLALKDRDLLCLQYVLHRACVSFPLVRRMLHSGVPFWPCRLGR